MSDPRRVEGERVFCHQCGNEWARANGGITCPSCQSEFVEIRAGDQPMAPDSPQNSRPASARSTAPPNGHPFHDHNPWADTPDTDEDSITPDDFNIGAGGRRAFTFTTRTFRIPGGHATFTSTSGLGPSIFPFPPAGFGGAQPPHPDGRGGPFPRDARGQPAPAEMQDLLSAIFQTMQTGGIFGERPMAGMGGFTIGGGTRNSQVFSPLDLLGAIFSPTGRAGDAVFSQEALDRIIEQLAEQNQGNSAPGPASEQAIRSLGKKKVSEDMMGSDGTAECSICMDNVEIGNTVTELPCKHWFHHDCVVAWLKEHDTCPHCRRPITNPDERPAQGSRRPSSRRMSSARESREQRHRSSAEGSGTHSSTRNVDYQDQNGSYRYDNSSAYAEARESQFQYPSQQMPPRQDRQSGGENGQHSAGRHGSDRGSSGGSGVTGWVRNRLGFG